jgi:hypothetical protein
VTITVVARNYRGFKNLEVNLSENIFVTGDNSSGKSSILLLLSYVLQTELTGHPLLDEQYSNDRYDFFSPYLGYSDVDIGFTSTEGDKAVGKMVTIKRSPDGIPFISRMTWVEEGNRFTLKWSQKKAGVRSTTVNPELSTEALYELHHETTGFKSLSGEDVVPGFGANSQEMIYSAIRTLRLNGQTSRALFNSIRIGRLPGRLHSGPVRGMAERFYNLDRKITASGTHFASMWHDMAEAREKISMEAVKKFGRDGSLFEDISVDKVSKKVRNSPLMVTVTKQGHPFLLSQVGVGVSQVIPIVVESAFHSDSPNDHILLLQQPELHLHPVAQAALGEFIYSMSKSGLRYVVETHSDYLIDRFRANMREEKSLKSATIVFCENTPDGNCATRIQISEGEIINPPSNYKNFFVTELMRTMF